MADRLPPDVKIERLIRHFLDNTVAAQECLIWQGKARTPKPNKLYGRVHIKYPGEGWPRAVQSTVHRVVYALVKRRPDIIKNVNAGDVSHLCGEHLCINPDHLTLENHADNCQRRTCHGMMAACSCQPPCYL